MTWWASASALQKSVGGLVAIVGLILAIKSDGIIGTLSCLSWFPGKKNISEEDYFVPGLQNHGNNCFLNVILQALASCSHFQPFLEDILEETKELTIEEISEDLSLTEALDAVLRGLQILSEKTVVLSPIKVMNEMSYHIPNFRLMIQQDASEAMSFLINSLRKESLNCYVPNRSPLAIPIAFNGRILSPEVANDQSEQERWQKHFLGPFDGITGSILTCQSCSSQLSLDFEFFHTLILSPVTTHGSTIMEGCSLFDCLRQFTVAQRENWRHCRRCWHAAAATYLSLIVKSEGERETVEACTWGDSCECKSLSGVQNFPWSDNHCRIVRRAGIVRSPQILCIQLARAAMVECGDAFKLKGSISFPLVLDLSPFMFRELGSNVQGNMSSGPWTQQLGLQQQGHIRPAFFNPQSDRAMLNLDVTRRADESHQSMQEQLSNLTQVEGCSSIMKTDGCLESKDKMVRTPKKISASSHFYRLVSVVEHLGGTESGHYTVYRSMRTKPPEECHPRDPDHFSMSWFRISDAEVERASEADVLETEASLLFYERIPEGDS